jgi:lipoprotein-anchoring transpeptidase ErfK/SrfK
MVLRTLAAMVLAVFMTSAALATKVVITVSKPGQKMHVIVDGAEEYVWPVSTGARGYDTPSGTYQPFRMEKDHFSEEWDDAPMPNSIFFTGEGHAIHGSFHTKRLGRPVSHGCVRLAPANAAKLYSLVQRAGMRNTTVIVKGGFDLFGGFAQSDSPRSKKYRKPGWLNIFE